MANSLAVTHARLCKALLSLQMPSNNQSFKLVPVHGEVLLVQAILMYITRERRCFMAVVQGLTLQLLSTRLLATYGLIALSTYRLQYTKALMHNQQ